MQMLGARGLRQLLALLLVDLALENALRRALHEELFVVLELRGDRVGLRAVLADLAERITARARPG